MKWDAYKGNYIWNRHNNQLHYQKQMYKMDGYFLNIMLLLIDGYFCW